MVDDGASDAHRNPTHGDSFSLSCWRQARPGAGKTQQFFLNVGRDGGVVGITDIMAVIENAGIPF